MRNGRADALGIFFSRYYRLVFDITKRILRDRGEAEDILQDVFIEVFRKANLYDSAKAASRHGCCNMPITAVSIAANILL